MPGPGKLLAAESALLIGSFLIKRPARASSPPRAAFATLSLILVILAAAGVLLFSCVALSAPMGTTDFLAIWGLKGRTMFAAAAIPGRLFHDPALAWAHPEYPLLVPLTFASLAAAVRGWDDRALALFYPACQLATVLALLGFLSRRVSRQAGAAAACLAALCFPLYAGVNVGTAEIPLAFGLVIVTEAAVEERQADSSGRRIRLALASLFCAATKQEGAFFVLLLLAGLLLGRRAPGGRRGVLWAALPVVLHGLVLRLLRGPVTRRDFDLTLLALQRWGDLLSRLAAVGRHIATVELRQGAIAIAAILLFLALTRRGFADWLFGPLIAQVFFYAGLCALSAFGPIWLVEASFARITLTLFPVVVLILASRLGNGVVLLGPTLVGPPVERAGSDPGRRRELG